MHAGDPDRPRFAVQTVVERRTHRQNPAAGTVTRFEDDDLASGLSNEIGRAQAGEARPDDDDRIARGRCARLGESLQQRRRSGSRERGELEKPSTGEVSPHVET